MPTLTELINDIHYRHTELIAGTPRPMLHLPLGRAQGMAVALFSMFVGSYVLEKGLGVCYATNTGFHFKDRASTVKAPDFAFITEEKVTYPEGIGFIPEVPDLVVETGQNEMLLTKIAEWLHFGVRHILDLDAKKRVITVHRLNTVPVTLTVADTFVAEDILPGFTLPLSKVFPVT
jgi:Uma2 family endonuclease